MLSDLFLVIDLSKDLLGCSDCYFGSGDFRTYEFFSFFFDVIESTSIYFLWIIDRSYCFIFATNVLHAKMAHNSGTFSIAGSRNTFFITITPTTSRSSYT